MTTTTKRTSLRPFHETIVGAMLGAGIEVIFCLGDLIKATEILEGHDEIIVAWGRVTLDAVFANEVIESLLAQKQTAQGG